MMWLFLTALAMLINEGTALSNTRIWQTPRAPAITCRTRQSIVIAMGSPLPAEKRSSIETSQNPMSPRSHHSSSGRRKFVIKSSAAALSSVLSLAATTTTNPRVANADDLVDNTKPLVSGTVTLPSGVSLPPMEETVPASALYITARPNSPDNVPSAILSGTKGRPPPVLAARLTVDSFPVDFHLTSADLTMEGATAQDENGGYWWKGIDLVVSARWDTDGVAATRDPTDMVGRGMFMGNGKEGALIALQGRGFTGKLVTGKSSSGKQ